MSAMEIEGAYFIKKPCFQLESQNLND